DVQQPAKKHDLKVKVKVKNLNRSFNRNLNRSLNRNLKRLDRELSKTFEDIGPKIAAVFNDIDVHITTNVNDENDEDEATKVISGNQEEKVKVYSKSYSADKDDVLEIDNQYGNITINTWNRNEFKIEIKVSVASNKAGEAQRMMDDILISDSKVGSTVSFKTRFNMGDGGNNTTWSSFFSSKKSVRSSDIVYNVYMPAKNALLINSKYGSVTLPDMYGKVTINNTYGKLYAKSLNSVNNNLNLKYCDVDIDQLGNGNVNLSYGSLKLGKIGKLAANVNYAPVSVGQLLTSGDFNIKYGGGLKIGELGTDLKILNINSAYSNVDISLNGKESFDFDVTVSYNSFDHDNNVVKVTTHTPDDGPGYQPTKNYKGYVGRSNSNTKVTIVNKYQGVSIE
ncbi:MAG: hypothetical protein ABIN95_03530, partial [Mucilaginibacter sp.]